jgi:hypothetical protein
MRESEAVPMSVGRKFVSLFDQLGAEFLDTNGVEPFMARDTTTDFVLPRLELLAVEIQ